MSKHFSSIKDRRGNYSFKRIDIGDGIKINDVHKNTIISDFKCYFNSHHVPDSGFAAGDVITRIDRIDRGKTRIRRRWSQIDHDDGNY